MLTQTELTLAPLELLDRLAALIPLPRRHRHHYAGVFALPARDQDSRAHAHPLTEMSVWTSYPSSAIHLKFMCGLVGGRTMKIEFTAPINVGALAEALRGELDSSCRIEQKVARLVIVESPAKGCSVALRDSGPGTRCTTFGMMPSILLRAALLVGLLATASAVATLIAGQFSLVVGGAVPIVLLFLIMPLPSRDLMRRVDAALVRIAERNNAGANHAPATQRTPATGNQRAGVTVAPRWVWPTSAAVALVIVGAGGWLSWTSNRAPKTGPSVQQLSATARLVSATGIVQLARAGANAAQDSYELEATVPAVEISHIAVGQHARVVLANLADAIAGTVQWISPLIDRETDSVQVRVRLLGADPRLQPEIAAEVVFLDP